MVLKKKKKILSNHGMFRPLEKKRYSEQIAELIQERILKDRLEIDTLLPTEKELALEFQVSRSVIREALRILEVSGLVNIKKGPSGGIFVTDGYGKPIKKSLSNLIASGEVTIDHLFDVRMLIEPHMAMEAALHASDDDLKNLVDLFSESSQHQDDADLLKENNLKFHLLLAKASGNPIFSILLKSVFELLTELSFDFVNLKFERHFYKAHREIFDVIKMRRPEEVKRLLEKDILDVREKLKGYKKRSRAKSNSSAL